MCVPWGFSGGSEGIESACHAGGRVLSPGLGSSPGGRHWQPIPVFLPGESPWTEEPDRRQSMGSQKVRHDLAHMQDKFLEVKVYEPSCY